MIVERKSPHRLRTDCRVTLTNCAGSVLLQDSGMGRCFDEVPMITGVGLAANLHWCQPVGGCTRFQKKQTIKSQHKFFLIPLIQLLFMHPRNLAGKRKAKKLKIDRAPAYPTVLRQLRHQIMKWRQLKP